MLKGHDVSLSRFRELNNDTSALVCENNQQLHNSNLEGMTFAKLLPLACGGDKLAGAKICRMYLMKAQLIRVQSDCEVEYQALEELINRVNEVVKNESKLSGELKSVQNIIDVAIEKIFERDDSSKEFHKSDSEEIVSQPPEDLGFVNVADLAEYILTDNNTWFEENSERPEKFVTHVTIAEGRITSLSRHPC